MADTNEANMTVPEMKLELVPVPVSDVDRARPSLKRLALHEELIHGLPRG